MPKSGMELIDWNGEHYLLTLANLWANLISSDPPELPQLIIGWWEISKFGINFAKCQIWDKYLGLAHRVNWRLLCKGWCEEYRLLLSRVLAFGLFGRVFFRTKVYFGTKSCRCEHQDTYAEAWLEVLYRRQYRDGVRYRLLDFCLAVFSCKICSKACQSSFPIFPFFSPQQGEEEGMWPGHVVLLSCLCISCMYWWNLMLHPLR